MRQELRPQYNPGGAASDESGLNGPIYELTSNKAVGIDTRMVTPVLDYRAHFDMELLGVLPHVFGIELLKGPFEVVRRWRSNIPEEGITEPPPGACSRLHS